MSAINVTCVVGEDSEVVLFAVETDDVPLYCKPFPFLPVTSVVSVFVPLLVPISSTNEAFVSIEYANINPVK
jgi:hypothetical protein